MLRLSNIKLSVRTKPTIEMLKEKAAKMLRIATDDIKSVRISRQSIDARDKSNVLYVFSIDIEAVNEEKLLKNKYAVRVKPFEYIIPKKISNSRPLIIGFGPAGFMAGLTLAKAGLRPIIAEQGKSVEMRRKDVEKFWQSGTLNLSSNIQFGEGGAGTFSDGKLTTGIKDFRCRVVLEEFVKAGAPEEILYLAKPHIGTDNLMKMVKNIRQEIISLGGNVLFETKLTDIEILDGKVKRASFSGANGMFEMETENIILAVGHSARDTFELLHRKGIHIEQKAFSVGVRIEHSQEMINKAQYGKFAEYLPAADYKLFAHLQNGRSVYTFCMCPGGVVTGAASESEHIVTNGMSYYKRDGKNANSAVLIGVYPSDFGSEHPLAGIEYQRRIENNAFIAGGRSYFAPVQTAGDFLVSRPTVSLGNVYPTYMPGTVCADFNDIFPNEIYTSLQMGIKELDKKLNGFANPNALLTAPETRSSSPVRILRDENYMSNIEGLIPCGEGCGYAGGIVSAAVDGIRCAEAVIRGIME